MTNDGSGSSSSSAEPNQWQVRKFSSAFYIPIYFVQKWFNKYGNLFSLSALLIHQYGALSIAESTGTYSRVTTEIFLYENSSPGIIGKRY